jgi:hypothetical protein
MFIKDTKNRHILFNTKIDDRRIHFVSYLILLLEF